MESLLGWLIFAVAIGNISIARELRMIRKRMGGTVHFWPWKED